jgi:lambda repressor-like predicted transcriptional regulator
VELVRLYSNLLGESLQLLRVRHAASSPRPTEGPKHARQHPHRLSQAEVLEQIAAYGHGESIKQLAQRFGIHRMTVTALLRRHGVELRRAGLTSDDVVAASRLYAHGWSLAKLGRKFGVNAATVLRALRACGVTMRSPAGR